MRALLAFSYVIPTPKIIEEGNHIVKAIFALSYVTSHLNVVKGTKDTDVLICCYAMSQSSLRMRRDEVGPSRLIHPPCAEAQFDAVPGVTRAT